MRCGFVFEIRRYSPRSHFGLAKWLQTNAFQVLAAGMDVSGMRELRRKEMSKSAIGAPGLSVATSLVPPLRFDNLEHPFALFARDVAKAGQLRVACFF